jgi:homoserine O-acetyltransferase
MPDHDVYELTDVVLQSGVTLPRVELAYGTYGEVNAARDNVIVMPTYFGAQHADTEAMIGAGRALDPQRYCVVVPNMLGNGVSSSPSNTPPPFDRAAFPNV